MEKYPAYKDSGIKWIGEIPEHWELINLKRVFSVRLSGIWGTDPKNNHNDKVCLRVADFDYQNLRFKKLSEYTIRNYSEDDIKKYSLKYGSILVEKSGGGDKSPVGRCVFFDLDIKNALYANFLECLTVQNNFDSKYIVYYLSIMYSKRIIWKYVKQTTGIQNLNLTNLLSSESIYVPPLPEQQSIASFLEKETSRIDNYIKQRESEISLLNELKQAEIANAVTKGLNPDAKMKDSGIAWIGEIPEHWQCHKIRYLFKERSQKGFQDEPVLSATQSYGVIPQDLYENRVVVVNKGLEGLKLVEIGDFVISLRSFQGGIEYAYYRGIISAAYTIIKPSKSVNSNFIKYLFKSYPFIELLKTCVTGIREGQNINYKILRDQYLALPSYKEQQQIVEYIESKVSQIEVYVSVLKSEIEQMQEYKQRLISDAVTGKIKVPEVF